MEAVSLTGAAAVRRVFIEAAAMRLGNAAEPCVVGLRRIYHMAPPSTRCSPCRRVPTDVTAFPLRIRGFDTGDAVSLVFA
jgi:hypothetical protein